ncbi:MAG: integrase, partial [Paracoccaceae bacterium]
SRDGFLFPGVRKGVISDASMARHMERLGLDARPHGFRSSFRTWADTETTATFEVKEMALAHKVGNVVSQTYLRTDYLDERTQLSQAWANFASRKPADVTQLFEQN